MFYLNNGPDFKPVIYNFIANQPTPPIHFSQLEKKIVLCLAIF